MVDHVSRTKPEGQMRLSLGVGTQIREMLCKRCVGRKIGPCFRTLDAVDDLVLLCHCPQSLCSSWSWGPYCGKLYVATGLEIGPCFCTLDVADEFVFFIQSTQPSSPEDVDWRIQMISSGLLRGPGDALRRLRAIVKQFASLRRQLFEGFL